jgi:hypothetical protein
VRPEKQTCGYDLPKKKQKGTEVFVFLMKIMISPIKSTSIQ